MSSERKVGVAVDFSACSRVALQWAVNNVLRKGDHLILVNIRPEANSEDPEVLLWETTGSRTLIHSSLLVFITLIIIYIFNFIIIIVNFSANIGSSYYVFLIRFVLYY